MITCSTINAIYFKETYKKYVGHKYLKGIVIGFLMNKLVYLK